MSQEKKFCWNCRGTGKVKCDHCGGKGFTTGFNSFSVAIFGFPTLGSSDCDHCNGSGKEKCPSCKGTGKSNK